MLSTMRTKYLPYTLFLLAILQGTGGYAQFGPPVFNQDFGIGNSDPGTIGPPLQPGRTGLKYSAELCPPPGAYTIVRSVGAHPCFNNEWIPLYSDYSSDNDPDMAFGNMMLVNRPDFGSRMVYVDTVSKNLCPGTQYRFSTAIINVDKPDNCPNPSFPSLNLSLETVTGQVMQFISTGQVGFASPVMGYKFGVYAFIFTMPAGIDRLVLKIELNYLGLNNCGDDFAIDDIQLTPLGPKANIGFMGVPASNVVTSVCFQDNKTVSMYGTLSSGYANPAIQWQQSTDGGNSWMDIPGATNNLYAAAFSIPDTFLFRLSGAEEANISNQNCRVVSNKIKVEVDGLPTTFNVTSNSPVCSGQNLQFDATEGFAFYYWNGPNGFFDDSPFAHIFNSTLADSGMYYVQMVTPGGCRATDSTYVTMIGTDVTVNPDTAICMGTSARLLAKASGSTGYSYSWSPSASLTDATISNPKAAPDATTQYTVNIVDGLGCTNTASVTVNLLNSIAVKAGIDASAYICRSYDSASFKDRSLGKVVSWNWDFGNGQTSISADPAVQYYRIANNITNYTVRLAVMDTTGCTDTAYHFLQVAANCYIAVPSAFTPNGDGLNDYLYPLNAYKATDLLFSVYNRFGQPLFLTRDWTRKWDGTVGGKEQGAGVYVWVLDYTDASRKKISLRGTTVLIR